MQNKIKIEPFLNRNIIKDKSDNITFTINQPKFENIVLYLDKTYEKTTAYFTVLYVNNEYKLYYRGCPYSYYKDIHKKIYYTTDELAQHEYICLATSNDGLNFEKKKYNIVNYNNSSNNNILKHDLFCHNFYPFYDKNNNKYIGISGTRIYNQGLHLFESIDGIHWIHVKKILDESHILPWKSHSNHFDSHNCILYNELEEYYYIYLRDNQENRFVQFTKTIDFNTFTKCQRINIPNNNHMVLYTPGIFTYENTNYLLSIPSIQDNSYDNKNNSTLMVSDDGINFNILTTQLFKDNTISMNINSIVSSPDSAKMYIYTHCNIDKESFITCHSFEQNRINKIICNGNGFIKTQLLKLINNMIILNYETFNEGYLSIKLINNNNEVILDTHNFNGNYYNFEVKWNDNKNINASEQYYIQFEMNNCYLYSFSYGYQ